MAVRRAKKRRANSGNAALLKRLRAAERRSRELEQLHEVVMGAINEGVYDWNVTKDTIHYTDRVQKAVGLPPELMNTTADWRKRIHPEDLPRYLRGFIDHFKGKTERYECDYRYQALDGSWRWARQHGIALRDRRGRATRVIGSTGDITALKQAEELLRKSEERYALATSAATEGIYEWDVALGSLFLTERAKDFFSLVGEQLTPAAWNTRINAEDYAGYRAAIVDHFKSRTSHLEHEYRIADGHGGYKWVLDRGIAVRNAESRVIKMVGALTDITQRKRAEIELRHARDQAEESLEQQTATAEILKVTSRSPTDIEPVFRSILSNASRLCQASVGAVFLFDGEVLTNVAHQSASPEFAEFLKRSRPRPSRETTTRRCALERRTVHTADLLNDPDYTPLDFQRRENVRTVLSVPMIREDRLVGVITLWRRKVNPFTDKQIALVQTFAAQAVIAIENARLFNETKEALERQTATAEILKVISSSPTDTQPVFDAIVQSGIRLFEGAGVTVTRPENGQVRLMAIAERDPERARRWKERFPFPLTRGYMHGVAILDCRMVDMPDVEQMDESYAAGKRNFAASGYRAMTVVPMVKDGAAIGTIAVVRDAPGPLSDKQIALLRTFADQAVIAIENVRLFNETREALEQQKASGEVLAAIGNSIADTKPVFDKILQSCGRLFAGKLVGINLVGSDGLIRLGAYQGPGREELEKVFPLPIGRESGSGLAIVERRVMHYPDAESEEEVPDATRQGCKAIGIKSAIFAPMIRGGQGVGTIFVGRDYTGSFSEKEIALLRIFAGQAAIAIQNARLFREIQEKSRQLEVANRHKSEFLANMSHELRTPLNAIIGFTRIVMRRSQESLEPKQYENLEKILASAQNLLALINAILDLSKVEAGRVEVNPAEIPLAPVLEHCIRTVEPLVKSEAVTLVKQFDGELPQVYVDEEKLRQIIINLLSNAVKFTARGTISVEVQCTDGGKFAVAVSDTGIGIPADKLEHIFEEFEQADAGSTRIYGGTGLGLTIARRLARLMGGDIAVESIQGEGSRFTLTLPVRYQA